MLVSIRLPEQSLEIVADDRDELRICTALEGVTDETVWELDVQPYAICWVFAPSLEATNCLSQVRVVI